MELHKEFDVFRGKVTTKEDNEVILVILEEMRLVYEEMAHVINFVLNRYKVCSEIIHHCNAFLNEMNKNIVSKKK